MLDVAQPHTLLKAGVETNSSWLVRKAAFGAAPEPTGRTARTVPELPRRPWPALPEIAHPSFRLSDKDCSPAFLRRVCGWRGTPCRAAGDPFPHLLQPLFPQSFEVLVSSHRIWGVSCCSSLTQPGGQGLPPSRKGILASFSPPPPQASGGEKMGQVAPRTLSQEGRECGVGEQKETGPSTEKKEARLKGVCVCTRACAHVYVYTCMHAHTCVLYVHTCVHVYMEK